ncbi:hypothetical protein ACET3Z_031799 [Daucus carota]
MKSNNNSTSNRVSVVIKPLFSVLSSLAKGKWGTIKAKTETLKAKLVIFSLLKPKHLPALGAISHKIHALVAGSGASDQQHPDRDDQVLDEVQQQQMVEYYYNNYYIDDHEEDDNKYPDLRHCFFDEEEDDGDDPNASAIDQVRNSKQEEGHDFSLEDEIDQVADLFINKFHKRMRIQKLASFKRYQAMLSRST